MLAPKLAAGAASLPPEGAVGRLGTECRGSGPACAGLDGTKASRVSQLAARRRP